MAGRRPQPRRPQRRRPQRRRPQRRRQSRRQSRPTEGCCPMKFNPNARLDTSQVQDRRGGGSGGGGFGGIPGGKGGLAVGGGGLGLIAVIVIVLISQFAGGGASSGTAGLIEGASGNGTVNNGQLENACKTGADASTSEDCATVAVINSVQDYWACLLYTSDAADE